jgi:hypothetical protein
VSFPLPPCSWTLLIKLSPPPRYLVVSHQLRLILGQRQSFLIAFTRCRAATIRAGRQQRSIYPIVSLLVCLVDYLVSALLVLMYPELRSYSAPSGQDCGCRQGLYGIILVGYIPAILTLTFFFRRSLNSERTKNSWQREEPMQNSLTCKKASLIELTISV